MINKIKEKIWLLIFYPYYSLAFWLTKNVRNRIHISNTIDTVNYIINHKSSVSRFGDGEFQIIMHYLKHGNEQGFNINSFQNYNPELALKLKNILLCQTPASNHIVCIPYSLCMPYDYSGYSRLFWERCWLKECIPYLDMFNNNINYYDASFTRFYMGRTRKWKMGNSIYIRQIKKIWEGIDICFIEGEKSRLGVGNDLFNNAKSITRLLVPAIDAYSKYKEIISRVKQLSKNKLYLLAIGQTATVLSYDMAVLGFWAIDIGHIDIEYEWMKMKTKHKVAVPNKYVNEVKSGRNCNELLDNRYESQIIGKIL